MAENNEGLKNKKVLIVEDDTFLHSLLSAKMKQLRDQGVEVFPTLNADDAYAKAKEVTPDVILLDLAMPGKNGLDFLKELRQEAKFEKTPVIILSNMSSEEDKKKADDLKVVAYFVKADFALDELVSKISEVLQKNIDA